MMRVSQRQPQRYVCEVIYQVCGIQLIFTQLRRVYTVSITN